MLMEGLVRTTSVVAIVSISAVCSAGEARADGVTYLPDDPAFVFAGADELAGVSGAAVAVDGQLSVGSVGDSTNVWTLAPNALELEFQHLSTTQVLPQIITQGAFVFRADATQSYAISGGHAYEATAPGGFGDTFLIVRFFDATTQTSLFANTLAAAPSAGRSFEIGDPTFFLEGSQTGRLVDGHVYRLEFDIFTTNFNNGTPPIAAEGAIRLSVTPLTTQELADLAQELAEALGSVPLSNVDAPNANSAAGRLGSLVDRVEHAVDAIESGDGNSARAQLRAVRERLDGNPTPKDWLLPSATQAALLAEIDVLLELLD